jgi:hypothetical protein
MYLVLDVLEKQITQESLDVLELELLTDLKNYKNLMSDKDADFLKLNKLEMNISVIWLNANNLKLVQFF